MFDHAVDAYMSGHYRVEISSHQNDDGSWTSTFEAPSGQKVEATDSSQNEAHRQCETKVREAVLKRELHLGR